MIKIKKILLRPIAKVVFRFLSLGIAGRRIFFNRIIYSAPLIGKHLKKFGYKIEATQIYWARTEEYKKWYTRHAPNSKLLKQQAKQSKKFKRAPLISVIVPVYNPSPQHLRECLDSVINQSYSRWQLCVADDASANDEIRKIIKEYAENEPRINYVLRSRNGHISKASNSALELAEGEYIALLDHDDYLWPNALFEIAKLINEKPDADFIYSDEDKLEPDDKTHTGPFFKPDWSPHYLRSVNYITHFAAIKKNLIDKVGGFRPGYEGAQDWDLFLRITRVTDKIYHIPTVLYSWRKSQSSTAQTPRAKNYAYQNQKKALLDDAKARGYKIKLSWAVPNQIWKAQYAPKGKPLISIIIPTKDQFKYIEKCLHTIVSKNNYSNYEIIIVDTGSTDMKVWQLYEEIKKKHKATRIIRWGKPFNFSAACNFGAKQAEGEYYLFLNNDTEVITPGWIEELLAYAQMPEVGAVGCLLSYPYNRIQHAGVVLGVGGNEKIPAVAAHLFQNYSYEPPTDFYQHLYIGGVRNFSAVTAACLMVNREKFNKVEGFDPKLRIAFNDIDFCLKLADQGLFNVFTPHANLYHFESASVGIPGKRDRDMALFIKEANVMVGRWKQKYLVNDPYYNPNLTKDSAYYRLKI